MLGVLCFVDHVGYCSLVICVQASFSHPGDSGMTIEEAGLGRQALLFVEQKPKEATGDSDGTVDEAEAAAAAGDEDVEQEL